jgi:hypothetical protein
MLKSILVNIPRAPQHSRPWISSAFLVPILAGIGVAVLPRLLPSLAIAPAHAREFVSPEAVRAINLARSSIVKSNGGLSAYRPAQCMFSQPTTTNLCLIRNDDQGFLFHFVGGPPAWEQRNQMPSKETELLISPEGRTVVEVIYNSTPRPPARAISLARTQAVTLNGGPRAYAPASCMSAPAATKANPCVVSTNAKGYRFRFMGGPPRWEADGDRPSQETEIQISPDGNSVVEVIYNGAPR